MKVEDFAYKVSARTMELLDQTQHYKIPEQTRKEISAQILKEVNKLLATPGK